MSQTLLSVWRASVDLSCTGALWPNQEWALIISASHRACAHQRRTFLKAIRRGGHTRGNPTREGALNAHPHRFEQHPGVAPPQVFLPLLRQ